MKSKYAIENLRKIVNIFSHCNESWNMRWTESELLKIGAFCLSEDGRHVNELPDTWTEEQVQSVLRTGKWLAYRSCPRHTGKLCAYCGGQEQVPDGDVEVCTACEAMPTGPDGRAAFCRAHR